MEGPATTCLRNSAQRSQAIKNAEGAALLVVLDEWLLCASFFGLFALQRAYCLFGSLVQEHDTNRVGAAMTGNRTSCARFVNGLEAAIFPQRADCRFNSRAVCGRMDDDDGIVSAVGTALKKLLGTVKSYAQNRFADSG